MARRLRVLAVFLASLSVAGASVAPLTLEISAPMSLNSDSMLQLAVAMAGSNADSSAIDLDSLSYMWAQTAGSGVDIPTEAAISPVLTVNSERASSFWLSEGGSLQFACRVSQRDAGGRIIAEGEATSAMIAINTPPLGGSLSVVTSDGAPTTALTTAHTLLALDFSAAAESGAGTLTYEFVCFTHRTQNVTRGNMLSMDAASSTVTSLSGVILPSAGKTGGTLTVGVVVRDARGAQTIVERDVFVGPSDIATSLSALQTSYQTAMLEPGLALATNAARRMYTTVVYMDAVAHAPLSFEDSNDAVAALYDSFRVAISSIIPHVASSLSLQAVQGLMELPQFHSTHFLSQVVAMCVALLNSLEKDARMQTEEFRSQFLAIIARVLREIPTAAASGSVSTAASIAAAAPLVTQAMDACFALLVSQSSPLQPHSQLDVTSSSGSSIGDVSLALFRTDGKRRSTNWLTIPNELGGDMVLNVSAVVADSAFPSADSSAAATPPARDYMLLATETHPILTMSLMTASQPNLISTFLGVSVRDTASSAPVPTFDRPLMLSVPYLATKCTLIPSADNLLCAPRCVLFDPSLGMWTTAGVATVLSRDSIAQNLALCALSKPGLVGVEQQLLLNPFFAEDSGASDKNPFSAKGLQVGGPGFAILVSITALVLLTASCLFLRAVRRANIERRHKVLRGLPPGALPPRFHPRRRSSLMRIKDYALGHADSIAASPEPPSVTEKPLPGETPQGLLSQSPTDSPLASPSALEDDLHAQYPMRSGAHAQFVPEFQEMSYPEPSTIPASTLGADGFHVAAEPIEGSATHTPFGRVLHYGAAASAVSSKASSARSSRASSKAPSRLASAVGSRAGSMPGSRAGSVHGSRAGSAQGSRAGSTVSSRAVSRRTSPDRGASLLVSVPAVMLQLPTSSRDRKRSFIIGELPNRAEEAMARQKADDAAAAAHAAAALSETQRRAARRAASSAAATAAASAYAISAAASSSTDYQSRRASTKFANLSNVAGVQSVFDPALLPPPSRRGGEDDSSFGSTKAKAIKFEKGMKHQITNVKEADDHSTAQEQKQTESSI